MNSSVVSSHTNGPARPHRRTNDGVVYVKRLPRCNEDEDQNENEGEGEGEGETRLIKRRPPPSANGPTVQELHAGNCCANTTTFILQPLGKRIYYSTRNTAPFSFSPFNLIPARASFILFSLFCMGVLDDEQRVENLDSKSRESLACLHRSSDVGNVFHVGSFQDHGSRYDHAHTGRPTYVFYDGIHRTLVWRVINARACYQT